MDATTTYDCKIAGCEKEARTNRGPNAYLCGDHISTKPPPAALRATAALRPSST